MVETLQHVTDAILNGRTKTFSYLRCFVVNYHASSEFPNKFFYNGCNVPKANGMFCAIRTDGMEPCGHNAEEIKYSQRMYRFELTVTDRSPSPPVRLTVFDQVQVFLGISAQQLSQRSPAEQLAFLKEQTEMGTPLELNVKVQPDHYGLFVAIVQTLVCPGRIQDFYLDDIMEMASSSPAPTRSIESCHTPRREVGGSGSTPGVHRSGSQQRGRGGRSKDEQLNTAKTKLIEDLIEIIDLSKEAD